MHFVMTFYPRCCSLGLMYQSACLCLMHNGAPMRQSAAVAGLSLKSALIRSRD